MSDRVNLKNVAADNWEAGVYLSSVPGQEGLVGSNLHLVTNAQFNPEARPLAVDAGNCIVGFPMYDEQKTKDKAQEASIYRFMIDRKHQGKGYGRATLGKALEKIRAIPGVYSISIRYMPENHVRSRYKPASASWTRGRTVLAR